MNSVTIPTRNNRILWLIAAVCIAPIIAAVIAYFYLRPEGGITNRGTLVQPQRPAVTLGAQLADGKPFEFAQLKGKWTMVTAGGGACDTACQLRLYHMRQIRISTGKNQTRVERVWLVTDAAPVDSELLKAHEGLIVARVDPQKLVPWLSANQDQLAGPTWFVDPRGNLMMQYKSDADPKDIRKDLGKLLWLNTAD
jgi:cytochrome oxidase Cu insertion factor (SCO1/SenC/PrrC family)